MKILTAILAHKRPGTSDMKVATVPGEQSDRARVDMFWPHHISRDQIEAAISRSAPYCRVIVLADSSTPRVTGSRIDWLSVESDSPDLLVARNDARIVVATLHHDLAEPFIRRAHAQHIPYISVQDSEPKGYLASNSLALRALKMEHALQVEQGWDKWDYGPGDFINLIQLLERTRNLPGSVMEIGTFMGSSAGVMLRYMSGAGISKRVDLIDVFDGFVYEEALSSPDAHWAGTHQTDGVARVARRLAQSRFPDMPMVDFHLHRLNIVTQDLPPHVVRSGLSLVNLDVDLYEAVGAGIAKVHPHLVPGGVLVVEDAGHTPLLSGARLALSEFLASQEAENFQAIEMESGQVLLIKLR